MNTGRYRFVIVRNKKSATYVQKTPFILELGTIVNNRNKKRVRNKKKLLGRLYLCQLRLILQFWLVSIRNITMQDRNNTTISIISYKYVNCLLMDDSFNIVIPSNDLKKGYIQFIKLGTFFFIKLRIGFTSKSRGGGGAKPPLILRQKGKRRKKSLYRVNSKKNIKWLKKYNS